MPTSDTKTPTRADVRARWAQHDEAVLAAMRAGAHDDTISASLRELARTTGLNLWATYQAVQRLKASGRIALVRPMTAAVYRVTP